MLGYSPLCAVSHGIDSTEKEKKCTVQLFNCLNVQTATFQNQPTTGCSQTDHRKGRRVGLKWVERWQLELRERHPDETRKKSEGLSCCETPMGFLWRNWYIQVFGACLYLYLKWPWVSSPFARLVALPLLFYSLHLPPSDKTSRRGLKTCYNKINVASPCQWVWRLFLGAAISLTGLALHFLENKIINGGALVCVWDSVSGCHNDTIKKKNNCQASLNYSL